MAAHEPSAPLTRRVDKTYHWQRALLGNVSTTSLALAFVLHSRMDPDGTIPARWTPSTETLSREMGYAANSRRAVARALRELQDRGYLTVVSGKGRKVVNRYYATVPVLPDVAGPPQNDAQDVANRGANSGQPATHPSLSNPINPQPSRSEDDEQPAPDAAGPPAQDFGPGVTAGQAVIDALGDSKRVASGVFHEVAQRLPAHEAAELQTGIPRLAQRDKLVQLIGELVRNGHRAELVEALVAVRGAGTHSPYERCENPARAFWARTRDTHRRLLQP